tara:strand:- start:13083 stop:13397 length:315 start_codon:yes stop_codon:yes gene_type:complete
MTDPLNEIQQTFTHLRTLQKWLKEKESPSLQLKYNCPEEAKLLKLKPRNTYNKLDLMEAVLNHIIDNKLCDKNGFLIHDNIFKKKPLESCQHIYEIRESLLRFC